MEGSGAVQVDVSVIIPVHNAGQWLEECLSSIQEQVLLGIVMEVSIFLDSCTDDSEEIATKFKLSMQGKGIRFFISKENNGTPKGVGYAKNKAVRQSKGHSLCFMDADDIMLPDRVHTQYQLLQETPSALVGSGFRRCPPASTKRYTAWANSLTPLQLTTQVFTSHGPTVIMPTWFCCRTLFDAIGGFSEAGAGEPEDLVFFYAHLRRGGAVVRAQQELLVYRYHDGCATHSVTEARIWQLRVEELSARVLGSWPSFTIWNAGKQGRRLYRTLAQGHRDKVISFCDVDIKKIGKNYTFEESEQTPKPKIPIVHFRDARPPFVICVKLDLTGGQFEENLRSLKLSEGHDYFHFN